MTVISVIKNYSSYEESKTICRTFLILFRFSRILNSNQQSSTHQFYHVNARHTSEKLINISTNSFKVHGK